MSHNNEQSLDSATEVHENPVPDFIHMKLFKSKDTNKEDNVDITLELNFGGEKKKKLPPFGTVKYGLKEGTLYVKLINAKAPYKLRYLKGQIQVNYDITREFECASGEALSNEKSRSGSMDLSIKPVGTSPKSSVKSGKKFSKSQEKTEKIKDTFKFKHFIVTTKGSEEEPMWSFSPIPGIEILKSHVNEPLCCLNIIKKPSFFDATFKVSRHDILISEVISGRLLEKLSQNKKGIINALILKSIFKSLPNTLCRHKDCI